MTRYLLDTNAFSQATRGSFPHFGRRFGSMPLTDMAISVVTEAELLFGLARRPEAHVLATSVHALLEKISILPWTSISAKNYAALRADLERRGEPMSTMDMMIAAHALSEEAVLVTNDAAFSRIEHLKVEDWTKL